MCWLLALLWAGVAQAEIYRWIDDQGRVHFGDRRPDDAQVETVEIEPETGVPAGREAALAKQRRELLNAAEKRQRSIEKGQRQAAERRARERRRLAEWRAQCEKTRDRIDAVLSEQRGGYSAARGEALQRRLDELRSREASQCR
jgi:hypothetical protein